MAEPLDTENKDEGLSGRLSNVYEKRKLLCVEISTGVKIPAARPRNRNKVPFIIYIYIIILTDTLYGSSIRVQIR